jgi:phosphoglucosamine mutase
VTASGDATAATPAGTTIVRRHFGTDGVRGLANAVLTPDFALRLGRAATRSAIVAGDERPEIVIGRDTRISGRMLEAALAAGIASAGGRAVLAGVLPTPGVAWLARRRGAALGAVISASHNPFEDNGIKFFGGDGFKLPDEQEAGIEALLDADHEPPTHDGVGEIVEVEGAADDYAAFLADGAHGTLGGLRIAVDCANGAAAAVAPRLFELLGADVTIVACEPDGININVEVGSTHLAHLAGVVRAGTFDLGLAFDGDADRLLVVDAAGEPLDGDHILAILARDLLARDALAGGLVVVTSMANLGLHRALAELGAEIEVTDVGDRYVLEAMRRRGGVLGGEQSGHVIALDRQTTGDGLMTAVLLLEALVRCGETVAEAAGMVVKFPQVLLNVRARRAGLPAAAAVWAAVATAEAELAGEGRIVLRASGTEELVRVMVEAPTYDRCATIARAIASVVERDLAP